MQAEKVKRVRAARGYAGLSQPELGSRLGVSRDTIRRIENADRALEPIEEEVFVRRVAEACGLPYEFFTVDFEQLRPGGALDPDSLEDRRQQFAYELVREALSQMGIPNRSQEREAAERDAAGFESDRQHARTAQLGGEGSRGPQRAARG